MTISELIRECALTDIELIKMYAGYVDCGDCPLRKKCTVKYEGMQDCVDYLASVLEVE